MRLLLKVLVVWACVLLPVVPAQLSAQVGERADQSEGLRGQPEAIEAARAMVQAMGGAEIWSQLRAVHFVHDWYTVNRIDDYREEETIDLTGARSWVSMQSEINSRIRAYSPEYGYWSTNNGEFREGDEEQLANAMSRAPFNLYRLARAIARDDNSLSVSFGTIEGRPPLPVLVFSGQDGEPGAWIMLNSKNEPQVWETTQYRYVFGPMERYGNLHHPRWATTSDSLIQYEMVSLKGSIETPEMALFAPPEGSRSAG